MTTLTSPAASINLLRLQYDAVRVAAARDKLHLKPDVALWLLL